MHIYLDPGSLRTHHIVRQGRHQDFNNAHEQFWPAPSDNAPMETGEPGRESSDASKYTVLSTLAPLPARASIPPPPLDDLCMSAIGL